MSRAINHVKLEKHLMGQLSIVFIITAINGFTTYLIKSHGVWQQWTYLAHALTGLYLTIIFLQYIYSHFRRTLGLRRPFVFISGILSACIILGLIGSGVHIGFFGQQEPLRWIYDLHIVTAILSVLLILMHLIVHRTTLGKKRQASEEILFNSIPSAIFVKSIFATLTGLGVILFLTLLYILVPLSYIDKAAHNPYEFSYGDHSFRPSQTETSTGGFLDARRVSRSDKCGTCHEAIAKQWKSSIHSQAGSDITYQTNINLLAEKKGIAATRYCEGCHAPTALLSGELTKGGRLDTRGHLLEGVSCMSCHGIDRILHVKGIASYRFAPKKDYLFADHDNTLANKITNFLIRIQPRQHRIDMARDVINSPKLCATCHAQFMDKDINDWGWVKMQDEYTAWLKSPYSQQSEQPFSNHKSRRCQDCHMPLTALEDPSANSEGLVVSHTTLGANTAIPWFNGDTNHLTQTIEFLRSNKMRISIEVPNRSNATRSNKFISPSISNNQESPSYYYLGEKVALKIAVSNVGVGHNFPGGTTDINEAWININIFDAQNNVLYSSGHINKDNNVDPDAYFYRSIAIDRHGNHVWKHDLFNMIGDSYKKIIPAGESDIVEYSFVIPSWVKGPITVSATLKYRKFNNRYAKWAFKDEKIKLPIVDIARTSRIIPILIKPVVEDIESMSNLNQPSNT